MATLKRLGSAGAAKHYRSSLSTITKWRRDIGIQPHERARRGHVRAKYNFTFCPLITHRDYSMVGQAADFLRRFAAVFRCDETGKVPKRGPALFWNRNGYVLTDEELAAKAARLGWKPARY